MTRLADADAQRLVDADSYAAHGYPHEIWTRLRRERPVAWVEPVGFEPFWAVTKHRDIRAISMQPDQFSSRGRNIMITRAAAESLAAALPPNLIQMDPPEHRSYRQIASPWFTPRNLKAIEERLRDCARSLVDRLADRDECDFVSEIAAPLPLRLIGHLLGIAPADEAFVLERTNELFGFEDREFRRSDKSGVTAASELVGFFKQILDERRTDPREDIATLLARATLDGEPMGEADRLGYAFLFLTAGHETTRNALSGGMLALIERPEECAKLLADPTLATSAAEEFLRWTTPVSHFLRTANQPLTLGGAAISEGDTLCLYYPSANRDEDVFAEPFEFRVDRTPNPHLAFGIGEHFCLGASLARMEIRIFCEEILPRLDHLELASPPERLASTFVGGIKHLPIRFRMRDANAAVR
ncbi:MAG: cytochrome P450 [Myxococcota bacterium]